ncbi:MAG: GNAT family N-acetyltransferase [Burkholderiales bacterium PBB4]|nr:MAG: GNAT family N-acetyltransferase [Burkholderiales bacterium PBB4]
MRTISTPIGILQPQVAAHAHEMFSVLSDVAIYEFEREPPKSEEWLRQRYERLESRGPSDGTEIWLNWVIRLPHGKLAGYLQATVLSNQSAYIAYELNSQYWCQGIGSGAVGAMLHELHDHYGVTHFIAVLKAQNFRSNALLRKLGFVTASEYQAAPHRDTPDEVVMVRNSKGADNP